MELLRQFNLSIKEVRVQIKDRAVKVSFQDFLDDHLVEQVV